MAENNLTDGPLQRVNPVLGMIVDVDAWQEAHDYHRAHARLHHRALHGWGIVRGLDVTPGQSVNALLIGPGIAVDHCGNLLLVDRQQVHRLAARTRGTVYVVLVYRDLPVDGNLARVLEGFSIEERTSPPADGDVELIRLEFDPQGAPVRLPQDAQRPRVNELDARGRAHLVSGNRADGSSGPAMLPYPAPIQGEIEERVRELARRIDEVAGVSERLDGTPDRLDALTRQVQALWQRPQPIPGSQPAVAVSESAPGWTVDQLATNLDVMGQRLAEAFEKITQVSDAQDEARHQLRALTEQSAARGERVDAQGVELERLRDRLDRIPADLDRLAPEVERIGSSLDASERRVLELTERVELAASAGSTGSASHPAGVHEVRLAVGRHDGEGWNAHDDGLRQFVRMLTRQVDLTATLLDPVDVADPGGVDLLYLTGQAALAFDDAQAAGIGRVLDAGGVVLGEGCSAGQSREDGAKAFAFSFFELAQRLGRRLARIERGHSPLLWARYVFGEPPPGARPPRLHEDRGMVYSDADYGCAWRGGAPDHSLPRTTIRDALEFGVNLVTYRQVQT
jgi:hypothetical protein